MKDFIRPDIKNKNRQELPIYYRINGAMYVAFCGYLRKEKYWIGKDTYAYIMPIERSVDIDSVLDFYLVEAIMRSKN